MTVKTLAEQTPATAAAAHMIQGATAWVNGVKITGTMPNAGAVSRVLSAGDSYTVPAGYHNGSGTVTAKTLAEQTPATATAANLIQGATAWVNGVKITGTGVNRGTVSKTLSAGESYTIPAGYHSGSGTVTAKTLAEQTPANAIAANLSQGITAWVNGIKITGTGEDNNSYYDQGYNNGYNDGCAQANTSYTVYKTVDVRSETYHDNVRNITVNCTDLSGYADYTASDFLVVPTSVYEKNIGLEDTHRLNNILWDYNNGILTIRNDVYHYEVGHDTQSIDLWYSSFDIYAR